jgi:hypothetical protein
MKTPTSIPRLKAAVLAVSSVMAFSVAGVAHSQYGGSASGQGGSSAGQGGSSGSSGGSSGQAKPKDSSGVGGYGVLDKGVESGKVDQRIRVERNKGTDPSVPPPVKRNEKGKVTEDPDNMQGGSIGPN